MTTRRNFIKHSFFGAGALMLQPAFVAELEASGLEISLAQWSLHRALKDQKTDILDFASVAKKEFGIKAVEYVNQFFGGQKMHFKDAATNRAYLIELNQRSKDVGVFNHLIMVDDEGDLAIPDEKERLAAVDSHKKWFDAAALLGCKTVRVNLHGKGDPDAKKAASIDSLSRLGEYAKPRHLNVVVENHGSDSSKAFWLVDIMKKVNKTNVGTLPDFGNFCVSDPWGSTQAYCSDMYDRYKGVEELMPFAKGVSAKTYDFDATGEQPKMDYKRLLDIVKKSGYKGYIGIEFEGDTQPEDEGIRKTKALIEKYMK